MKTTNITLKNIADNGYRTGKSNKKGTEILQAEYRLLSQWSIDVYPENLERLLKTLEGANLEELYVSKITFVSTDEGAGLTVRNPNREVAQRRFNLQGLIDSGFKGVNSVDITLVPQKVLGRLFLSKYTTDLESQTQLIVDLFALEGIKFQNGISDNNYDFCDENVCEFSNKDGDGVRYRGDDVMAHGDNSYVFYKESNLVQHVNGRVDNNNSEALEWFWNDDYDNCLKPYLAELDQKGDLTVYHRKGKDWYISPSLEEIEINIAFYDAEYNDVGEFTEEVYYALSFKENPELTEKFVEVLESYRDDISMKGFINSELDADELDNHSIVNHDLVDMLFDDRGDLKEMIENSIEWDLANIRANFIRAYQAVIDSKIVVTDDLKVNFTVTPSYSSIKRDDKVESYNHLKIIKAMEKRFEYKLVKTVVSENINTMAWALQKDEEEYHFDIAAVIANDIKEEVSLREFLTAALEALAKRKIERLSQAELFEKASHVFVGIDDSLLSGNCSFGTNQFIAKHHIDTSRIGGIRGDVLLQMEKSSFTMRAIMHAIVSHRGAAC